MPVLWQLLTARDRWVLAGLVVVLAATAISHNSPGVCGDDAGELQYVSSAGGMMHPPGYAALVMLGRLVTLLPVFEPAYRVTLGTNAAAIAAISLTVLLLTRLGLSIWIAAFLGLLLTWHKRVWQNLVTPEVYAPAWALLAVTIYYAARFAHSRARRDLLVSAFVYGLLVASRSAAVVFLPGLLLAWWAGARDVAARRWKNVLIAGAAVSVGVAACVAYLWCVDRSGAPGNYIDSYNAENAELPSADAGVAAKCQRLIWLLSGAEFRDNLQPSRRALRVQVRRLNYELTDSQTALLGPVSLLALAGSLALWKRQRAVFFAAWGAIVGGVLFGLIYHICDQALDVLPILCGATLLCGAALAAALRAHHGVQRWFAVPALLAATCSLASIPARRDSAAQIDATEFASILDMRSLPARSVLFAGWESATPMLYEQFRTGRSDITVFSAHTSNWKRLVESYLDRPVYYERANVAPPGWTCVPYRNVWHLVRQPQE